MFYPQQTDNYDIEIFNSNFRELKTAADTLNNNLLSETARAKLAESVNAERITQEQERARLREDAIESNFGTETQAIRRLISSIDTGGSGAGQEELNIHVSDETIHVTATDKQNWNTPQFTQASARENISSGETVSTLWGKVKKWFADLKDVAFSGSYNDLSDRPIDENGIILQNVEFRGNVRIKKNNANYGSIINIGDGDYIRISEEADDILTIKAKQINLKSTSANAVYINDAAVGATVLTGTLSAYSTSLSFTDSAITSSATIDVYTDVYGAAPTAMSISGNTLYLTFASRSSSMGVKVRIS